MPVHKPEVLRIYRLLSHENREELLTWVRLACKAENSVKKSLGHDIQVDDPHPYEKQENSCEKTMKRRKK